MIEIAYKQDKEIAKMLAERVALDAENSKHSEDIKNKIFDTVLNLNMLQGNQKIDLNDLQSESGSERPEMADVVEESPEVDRSVGGKCYEI